MVEHGPNSEDTSVTDTTSLSSQNSTHDVNISDEGSGNCINQDSGNCSNQEHAMDLTHDVEDDAGIPDEEATVVDILGSIDVSDGPSGGPSNVAQAVLIDAVSHRSNERSLQQQNMLDLALLASHHVTAVAVDNDNTPGVTSINGASGLPSYPPLSSTGDNYVNNTDTTTTRTNVPNGSANGSNHLSSTGTDLNSPVSPIGQIPGNGPPIKQLHRRKFSSGVAKRMKKLFGDSGTCGLDACEAIKSIKPRTLLQWSVNLDEQTSLWVAKIFTNQRALDSDDSASANKTAIKITAASELSAIGLAKAWTPPRMIPFEECSSCTVCVNPFSGNRRPCHCRNCGVCICNGCAVSWSSEMLPETYNVKRQSFVNICKACDWLYINFRLALLEGDHDKAVALHTTDNVNLMTPCAEIEGELLYPIHCAAIGGNLKLLQWLVDDKFCPILLQEPNGMSTPIMTSKRRSILGIALEKRDIAMVQYLVVEKKLSWKNTRDITMETMWDSLDLLLQVTPKHIVHAARETRASNDTS